ncbi:hypothetical protein ACFODZ_07350 [Marinicella sediminis]|uniref:Tetratricopeptide repeat protein n=1 Tax=Marinicella sediminis TaxID=1792834 RepID=A0ABV7JBF5_9GAMM|nr:hypothetical protein [Marinicella sediminis]
MKYWFILCLALTGPVKALDLDRKSANVAYIQLPTDPITQLGNRTVSTQVSAFYDTYETRQTIENTFRLHGFNRVEKAGYLHIEFRFDTLKIQETRVKTHKREDKNRDGQTRIKYTYTPELEYSVGARIIIHYPDGKQQSHRYGSSYIKHKGETTPSQTSAWNYLNHNINELRAELYHEFLYETMIEFNDKLNAMHGYQPIFGETSFLIMDSKKYPEYADYKKVEQDLKAIFGQMAPHDDVAALKPALLPIIRFLDEIPKRYPSNKRAHRKMRYASYYNIAQIHYWLDEFNQARNYFQKVIDNDYREGESKRMLKRIANDLQLLQINQVKSRHLNPQAMPNHP